MKKKILVPVDGSEAAKKAIEVAGELAELRKNDVVLYYVMPDTIHALRTLDNEQVRNEIQNKGKEILDEAAKVIEKYPIVRYETKLEAGNPAVKIIEEVAAGDYELIVMGSLGMSGHKLFAMGSVANQVSHHANCSILIVK